MRQVDIVILVGVIPQSFGSGLLLIKINRLTLNPNSPIVMIMTSIVVAVIAVIILREVSVLFADKETIRPTKKMILQTEYKTHALT